jgi:hypothetical protein
MSDQLLSFFFVGTIAEFVILLFMMFRRARGSCLAQLFIAFFAFFTGLMVLLAIAGIAEQPLAFTDDSHIAFPAAFLILAAIIVAVWRGAPLPAKAPRKRPLIIDMLGCAALGIIGLVLFVMGIGALTLLAR